MPVTKQAIKKVRQDKRKTAINLKVKQAFKKAVRDFERKRTAESLRAVYRAADRAAKVNVIHKNRAARIKSRLSKKLTGKSAAPQAKPASKKKLKI